MEEPDSIPVVRMAELEIDPAQLGSYRALLQEEIEVSIEAEPGVLMLFAMSIKGSPSHIRIVEVYVDQDAYESHLRSPHFIKYKNATAGMVRSLGLVETEPIIMAAKGGG